MGAYPSEHYKPGRSAGAVTVRALHVDATTFGGDVGVGGLASGFEVAAVTADERSPEPPAE